MAVDKITKQERVLFEGSPDEEVRFCEQWGWSYQPMEGLIERQDDWTGKYHDVLVYSRELTAQECMDYDLDFIGYERSKSRA